MNWMEKLKETGPVNDRVQREIESASRKAKEGEDMKGGRKNNLLYNKKALVSWWVGWLVVISYSEILCLN
jgi:hypothetical protein